jgi:hypothetical protein
MVVSNRFRYFGRTGGVHLREIYRCPDNGLPLWKQELENVQVAKPGFLWEAAATLERVQRDYLTGWFDDEDELTVEQVTQLLEKWNAEGWPA